MAISAAPATTGRYAAARWAYRSVRCSAMTLCAIVTPGINRPSTALHHLPLPCLNIVTSKQFTFWQGGVRGNAFITSPLLPAKMVGATWHGLAHAADWYTTIADLAGVDSLQGTGHVAPDGVKLWDAITSNSSSPRSELVLNIDSSANFSAFRQGRWKLIDGYPCVTALLRCLICCAP